MRIESSVVDYSVHHAYAERRQVLDEVRVEASRRRREVEPVRDRAEFSGASPRGHNDPGVEEGEDSGDARTMLAKLVVRVLLGGKFERGHREVREKPRHSDAQAEAPRERGARWNVRVRHREVYEEKESLVVAAKGAVKTADGREFQFDAAFSLERSFKVESESALTANSGGEVSDPLFLDHGGLSQLLVRDANGDGKLSDLNEVFGASTGDGFGELATFDADHNGWIDEGDPVFGQLRLRLQDGTLSDLGALGVGALSTSGAAGEFQYKNDANELVAVVRRTGVYLNENGTAGALRQIDLVM